MILINAMENMEGPLFFFREISPRDQIIIFFWLNRLLDPGQVQRRGSGEGLLLRRIQNPGSEGPAVQGGVCQLPRRLLSQLCGEHGNVPLGDEGAELPLGSLERAVQDEHIAVDLPVVRPFLTEVLAW